MSTSRSIASAINRRAGNNAPRPNSTVSQQQNFNPKIPQNPSQNQSSAPKNVRFVPSGQGSNSAPPSSSNHPNSGRPVFQEPTIPVKTAGVNGPVGQVSISDAFALVTIRLGRVEQFIQQIQEEGLPSVSSDQNNVVNSEQVNQVSQTNLLNDIQNIKNLFQGQQDTIMNLSQRLEKYEKEFRELKDMLFTTNMKQDKYSIETNTKISKLEENVKLSGSQFQDLLEKHNDLKNSMDLHLENFHSDLNNNQFIEDDVPNLKMTIMNDDNENENENENKNFVYEESNIETSY